MSSMKNEIDEMRQELYETKRQLRLNEGLLSHYQNDIELLQGKEQREVEKYEVKITNLEETVASLRSKHLENISNLESELQKKETEIEDLKNQIQLFKKKEAIENSSDVSVNSNEIINLSNENELLKEHIIKLEESFEQLQIQHQNKEIILEQHKEELAELRESMNIKKQELLENAILIDKLNDDLMCTKIELDNYKQKPLEADSKGNSLFAEVDDRRVYLQKTINEMKSSYMTLKQDHIRHVQIISQLRRENADLRKAWKKDLEEIQEDNYWVNDTLTRHLKVLEDVIEEQKKKIENFNENKSVEVNGSPEYRYYEQLIDEKSKETEQLKKKLLDKSVNEHLLSVNLAKAHRTLRLLRIELQQLSEELKESKSESVSSDESICHKCKQNIKERRQTMFIKKYVEDNCDQQAEREISSENGMTLEFDEFMKKIDLNNDPGIRKKESALHPSNNSDINYADTNPKNEEFSDKSENELTTIKPNFKEKKGVTFTTDTVDPVGNVPRKRGTRVFIVKKKD